MTDYKAKYGRQRFKFATPKPVPVKTKGYWDSSQRAGEVTTINIEDYEPQKKIYSTPIDLQVRMAKKKEQGRKDKILLRQLKALGL